MQDITTVNFWDAHTWDWLVLVGLAVFPRITTLFISGPFGLLQWLGWVFAPHLLVAIVATTQYWDTDPVLCVIAWFLALAGTGGEGKAAQRARRRWRRKDDDG